MDEPAIRELNKKLGFVGADKVWKAAKQEAVRAGEQPPTKQAVRDALAAVSTKQV